MADYAKSRAIHKGEGEPDPHHSRRQRDRQSGKVSEVRSRLSALQDKNTVARNFDRAAACLSSHGIFERSRQRNRLLLTCVIQQANPAPAATVANGEFDS